MTRRPTRLLLATIALLAQMVWLYALRGPRLLNADGTLVIGGLIVGMALVAIYPTLPTARRSQGRGLGIFIVLSAAMLQLAGLVWLWPVLSVEAGRDRLDGLLWLTGRSPYATTIEPPAVRETSPASGAGDAASVASRITQAAVAEAGATAITSPDRTAAASTSATTASAAAHPAKLPPADGVTPATGLPPGADALDQAVLPIHPSIDPPVAQSIFIAARALEMVAIGPAKTAMPLDDAAARSWRAALPAVGAPHRAMVLRIISAIAAIGAAVLTLRILRAAGRNPWFAVLLAWNPLLTLEAAGNGRVAVVGIALLLAMVRLLQKRNATFATIALVLACGVEPTAILLAPLLVRELTIHRNWRVARRCILVALGTLAVTYVPVLIGRGSFHGWMSAIATSLQLREGNSLFFAGIRSLFNRAGDAFDGGLLRGVLLLASPAAAVFVLIHVLRHRRPLAESAYWLLLIPLLLRPAIDPPAALWPLAFVPLLTQTSGWAALTWAATISIAYVAWHLPGGVLPTRIVLAEYVPVAVAILTERTDARAVAIRRAAIA